MLFHQPLERVGVALQLLDVVAQRSQLRLQRLLLRQQLLSPGGKHGGETGRKEKQKGQRHTFVRKGGNKTPHPLRRTWIVAWRRVVDRW